MVKVTPVPIELPPVDIEYHVNMPALVLAPSIIVPASQRAAGVVPDTVGIVFTIAKTEVLEELVQPLSEAST